MKVQYGIFRHRRTGAIIFVKEVFRSKYKKRWFWDATCAYEDGVDRGIALNTIESKYQTVVKMGGEGAGQSER